MAKPKDLTDPDEVTEEEGKDMDWWLCKTSDRLDSQLPDGWGYVLVLSSVTGVEGYVSTLEPEDARPAIMRCHSRLPGGGH